MSGSFDDFERVEIPEVDPTVKNQSNSRILAALPGFCVSSLFGLAFTVAGATAQLLVDGAGATAQLLVDGAGATGIAMRQLTASAVNQAYVYGPTRNGYKYTVSAVERDPNCPIFGTITFAVETHNGTEYTFTIRAEGRLNLLNYSKKVNGVNVVAGPILKYDPLKLNELDEETEKVLHQVYQHYGANQGFVVV
jgi:hypothetical protein